MLRRTDKNREADATAVRAGGFALLVLVLFLAASFAHAQLNSNIAGVNLAANLRTSLTVTATPGNVNFALVRNGAALGNVPITVNTSWKLRPGTRRVTTYAYFTTSAAALTDGAGDNIPSSKVSGSVNGGAFTAFTGNSPFAAGSSLTLSLIRIRRRTTTGNQSDTLNLMISTVGLTLPPGTYTGVLNIQAQAF
jgi:hypothetical protein